MYIASDPSSPGGSPQKSTASASLASADSSLRVLQERPTIAYDEDPMDAEMPTAQESSKKDDFVLQRYRFVFNTRMGQATAVSKASGAVGAHSHKAVARNGFMQFLFDDLELSGQDESGPYIWKSDMPQIEHVEVEPTVSIAKKPAAATNDDGSDDEPDEDMSDDEDEDETPMKTMKAAMKVAMKVTMKVYYYY